MAKTVYFSPYGGEVYAIIEGEGDSDYERSLPAGWKKASVTDAAAKDVNISSGVKFKPDKAGKMAFHRRDE